MIYEFLKYCENRKIIVFGLLPHIIYICQSLDVVVFESFKYQYKIAINNVIRTGYTKFNKTEFLNAIDSIRAKTFKKNTILSSWRKSGIFPYNPNVVLTKLREYEPYKERY